MNRPKKIKTASDLPVATLRRILADTERTAGADSQSARALRRALVKAERRENAAAPVTALRGAEHA
jgi:hypothetical protein